MKKSLPYFIGAVAIIALAFLLVGSAGEKKRVFNQRISLKEEDRIPYGFFAARQLAAKLFPAATFYSDRRSPGYWDSLSLAGTNEVVFLIGDLMADDDELENIRDFVARGNYVFIISKSLSYDAIHYLGFSSSDVGSDENYITPEKDSLGVRLNAPRFTDQTEYIYPGKRHSGYIKYIEPGRALVLGRNASGYANFVQFKVGEGNVFLHTSPLAFSNYFILHKNNIRYFEQALSVIPANVKKVVWNEYYLYKKYDGNNDQEPNWLGVLFKYPAFKWALLTAIFTLLLYMLLEMRRRQAVIRPYTRPTNASLDFVETIGRLYYDRKDHTDLARKISVYFLEHVRTLYKITTNELDDAFIDNLHYKSGYPQKDLKDIIDFIKFIRQESAINEHQLTRFHHQIEKFYQNT